MQPSDKKQLIVRTGRAFCVHSIVDLNKFFLDPFFHHEHIDTHALLPQTLGLEQL